MYQEFFSLTIKPFSISPDPSFLFLSARHKEAIAHLQHGLQSQTGFALLTGEVGTGKTTICRALLEEIDSDTDIVSVLNPAIDDVELLSSLCDGLNIEYCSHELTSLFELLSTWLINNSQAKRRTLIIIDEAQHLNFAALDQLRLLTNIENGGKKVLQVLLIGQTELQDKLKQTAFLPLAQRISARYHLLSLTQQESRLYIQHRLNIAGANHALFEKSALQEIFKQCAGTPRLTNILCDRSLLAAYTQDSQVVTLKMVKQASQEILLTHQPTDKGLLARHWRFCLLILLTLLTIWQSPQITSYLNPYRDLVEVNEATPPIAELVTPAATNSNNEQWFDGYPQLDLSKTRYRDALVSLYSVWGYKVEPEAINCDQKNSAHILCYRSEINLQQLKQLNYPSVIRLERESGVIRYAVLYKITADHAKNYQLLIDGNLVSVSEQWFKNYWRGETTLLWQAPFALKGVIKYAQEGDKVSWLADQLNKHQGWPSEHKSIFDQQLLEQVVAFQRQQGLTDDGIVGPRTLMHLMPLVTPNTPRLLQEQN